MPHNHKYKGGVMEEKTEQKETNSDPFNILEYMRKDMERAFDEMRKAAGFD